MESTRTELDRRRVFCENIPQKYHCLVAKIGRIKKNYEQLEIEKAVNKKFSFHLFPRDVERREKWLEVLNLENYNPPKSAAVCSAHFKENDYEQNHLFHKLKKDAVPHLSEEKIACTMEHQETNFIKIEDIEICEPDIKYDITQSIDDPTYSKMVHRSTSVSPERILNSPTKVLLQEVHAREIKALKRKLYLQNYNQRKMQRKLQSLKSTLKSFSKFSKNLLQRNLKTQNDFLLNLGEATKQLLNEN